MNARDLLRLRSANIRHQYVAQQRQLQDADDAQSILSGSYEGFDADSGTAMVRLPGGNLIAARLITNGAIQVGTRLQISTSKDSAIAHADEMPS